MSGSTELKLVLSFAKMSWTNVFLKKTILDSVKQHWPEF